jgi:hypothetical protein
MCVSSVNVKMDLREIGWDGMDRIYLAQDRDKWRALVNTAMKLRRGRRYRVETGASYKPIETLG